MFIIQIKRNMSCFPSPAPQPLPTKTTPGPFPAKAEPSAPPDEGRQRRSAPSRRRANDGGVLSLAKANGHMGASHPPTSAGAEGQRQHPSWHRTPFSLLRARCTLVFLSILFLFYIPNIRLGKLNAASVYRRVYL